MTSWHNATSLKAAWAGAPAGDVAADLLTVARDQVIAYAPYPDETQDLSDDSTTVPHRYRMAQALQAEALWNTRKANTAGDDQMGMHGYGIQLRDMGWTIKNLIRPQRPSEGLIG